ncbi:MAG: hypothetical protein JXR78_06100 [Victivallales bacterium]|nr:hypothetical protein [Victivallales bacterium]
MKFIAHRGESMDAPENTMESFRLAWERGADGVEGDFHMLKDRKIVCMHDLNAVRTTGENVDIQELDSPQIRRLDAGAWKSPRWRGAGVPLLDDIFAELPQGCEIYIELKDDSDGIVELIDALAVEHGVPRSQLVIISFSEKAVITARQLMPDIKVLLLTGLKYSPVTGFNPDPETLLNMLRRTGAHGVDCCGITELNREYIDIIKKAGYEFHVWTVNEPEAARQLIAAGVDSITSDCAAKLKEYFRNI